MRRQVLATGKEDCAPVPPPSFPSSPRLPEALHCGQGGASRRGIWGKMWTHSTFCRARGALKIFRSLLKPTALAVRLGAQGVLFPLHLIAAEVTVDRYRAALAPRHCFALATPGALDALCFNRHFTPSQTVTQVLYKTCVTAVKRPFSRPGGRVDRAYGGGALAAPPL